MLALLVQPDVAAQQIESAVAALATANFAVVANPLAVFHCALDPVTAFVVAVDTAQASQHLITQRLVLALLARQVIASLA